jgi:putative ABC transport system ATP-binding protein
MSQKENVAMHQTGIGMIFQAFYLIPTLTVIDNICLPKTFMGESLKERREAGMKLLQHFGIAEQAYKFPNQLSGGQKQRAAIARSLVNNPQIILADEPVGNLDSESAKNVLQILKDLNEHEKKTIIMVTHNPEHLFYGDRIIHMKDGKIIGEEVNKEKRSLDYFEKNRKEALAGGVDGQEKIDVPNDLKLLMRTLKNLNGTQFGSLLIPFKAKQLMSHVVSELNEEQLRLAEGFLKELLFNNIQMRDLPKKLDMRFEEGGANWNKRRAQSFSARIEQILLQAKLQKRMIENDLKKEAYLYMCQYLEAYFDLHLEENMRTLFQGLVALRFANKIDSIELKKKFDLPRAMGGVGLNSVTAEKVVREIEIIMLINFSD